jgi:hypothetical protein
MMLVAGGWRIGRRGERSSEKCIITITVLAEGSRGSLCFRLAVTNVIEDIQ